ncbi:hypothetical protein ACIA59_28510, partial [Micromonospora haikouensis]
RHLVSIDLGDHDIRHQVLLLDQELHRSFYSPTPAPTGTDVPHPGRTTMTMDDKSGCRPG